MLKPFLHTLMPTFKKKTDRLKIYAEQVGLNISKNKAEVITLNVQNPRPIKLDETNLPYTEKFTYLCSKVETDGGAARDIVNKIGKHRDYCCKKRLRWIGHVLHKDQNAIPRVAVQWKTEGHKKCGRPKITWRRTVEAEGHRKCGRPKITWRRTVKAETEAMGQSWGILKTLTQDRPRWREFVAALVANGKKGQ
ncbi:hypothetical protein ElyMa_000672900 [Elysia marginata]|uniref:Reverse transcriptase domain-containing protein n=1 Tax=Elysia marginata TaxID=1093978 RepID=A0AAV4GHR6_9GAST|nr:hypothetical protein ElyMa_000672900 [Elysia marginata]